MARESKNIIMAAVTNGNGSARVTLAVINEQLKITHKLVEAMNIEFREHLREHTKAALETAVRMDRLEQIPVVVSPRLSTTIADLEKLSDIISGRDGEPGLKGRLQVLEDHEETEKWYFRAIWVAIIGSIITNFAHFLGR